MLLNVTKLKTSFSASKSFDSKDFNYRIFARNVVVMRGILELTCLTKPISVLFSYKSQYLT